MAVTETAPQNVSSRKKLLAIAVLNKKRTIYVWALAQAFASLMQRLC
jgi:hypothetical protein